MAENTVKKLDYSVKSGTRCADCGEDLKQNAVNKGFKTCYVCHKVKGKKAFRTKYRVVNGQLIRPLVEVSKVRWTDLQKDNRKRNGWKGGQK